MAFEDITNGIVVNYLRTLTQQFPLVQCTISKWQRLEPQHAAKWHHYVVHTLWLL